MTPPPDRAFTPFLLFVGIYVALIAAVWRLAPPQGVAAGQWAALGCAVLATLGASGAAERRLPRLGIFVRSWPRHLAVGALLAAAAVGGTHLLILLSTSLRHRPGAGLSGWELGMVFLPAVIHEELVFRGYAFQALLRWNPIGAVLIGSAVFAVLHLGNEGIGTVPVFNIFLAGVLLALAVIRWRGLLVAIAAHLAWNVLSGPILGHEVSGWVAEGRLLETVDRGPALLTGGTFGIEASVLMTGIVIVMIAALARTVVAHGPAGDAADIVDVDR
ncbi:MAG TPA: CPBP family intramembrane glutamic endopeptidase [Thermoanaerobaculia bacterium]|nr:CPBP family intramembrane glutamic endopeptidase [Thermoanaerobaculia bacterium]